MLYCGRVFDGFLLFIPLGRGVLPSAAACLHLIVLFNVPLRDNIVVISSLQNAFVQLSLAFRNDNYTLETRLKQAERERNLTEEDTEKELEEFKGALKVSPRKTASDVRETPKISLWPFNAHSSS